MVEYLLECYASYSQSQDQIIIVPKAESISVHWGADDILKADMICMDKLVAANKVHLIQT